MAVHRRTVPSLLIAGLLAAALLPSGSPAQAVAGATSFTNAAAINVGDPNWTDFYQLGIGMQAQGAGQPFPAEFVVPHNARIADISVRLYGVKHEQPSDLEVLLVAPGGQRVLLMNGAGASYDLVDTNITFEDGAPPLPELSAITTDPYSPASYGPVDMPAPAPAAGAGTSLSALVGALAGGTWRLYAYDSLDEGPLGKSAINQISLFLTLDTAPYPSEITVGGVGTVTDVNVRLHDFNSTFPDDLDLLLVGPQGRNTILMADAGGQHTAAGVNLTLDDEAAQPVTDEDPLTSGTYKPVNYSGSDAFPGIGDLTGVPAAGLSVFDGGPGNGAWRLYAVDDFSGVLQSIRGGWSLDLAWDDSTLPTGSIVAAGGAIAVTNPAVTLAMAATDPDTGVTSMRFSNDGKKWSAYQSFAASTAWTLDSQDGTKTVYAQFRDGAGNESAVVSDTVVLDTTSPTAESFKPRKNKTGVARKAKVKVVASEPLDAASVTTTTVTLKRGSKKVKATVVLKGNVKIVLKPKKKLRKGTYTATVTTQVRDRVGLPFDAKGKKGAQALVWSFTVGS
jgi:subtilisin-like proprotein convertase family protein